MPDLAGLDRFKRGMGYEHRVIGQRIEMTRWLGTVGRGPATRAIGQYARRHGEGQTNGRAATTLAGHAETASPGLRLLSPAIQASDR